VEFHEKDLWTFLEDSSGESKSFSNLKIEKIQRPGGQQTLLKWGTASHNFINYNLAKDLN
jgi:hypothetical protein